MCFNAPMSLSVGLLGIFAGIYFYKKNKYIGIGIFYFGIMEILQFLQYQVIDKCESKMNKFLTTLGYIHICFQPLFINIWLMGFIDDPENYYVFLYMSVCAGILLLSRIIWVKDHEICNTNIEPLCGPKTCSLSGQRHIVWNFRLRAPGKDWVTPSIGLIFFMWVIPTLVMFKKKPIMALILTSPYLGLLFTDNIHESASVWCFTAIFQFIIAYLYLK